METPLTRQARPNGRAVPAIVLCILATLTAGAAAQSNDLAAAREKTHASDQWMLISTHLPDPRTATPAALELQADILRARRFPVDALDFYGYALARGGNQAGLLNKLGITELELHHLTQANAYLQRAVKLNRKDAEAWNNLGVIEYLNGDTGEAIADYKRAVKLEKRKAVFHSNLGTAYFERKDLFGARKEIALALKLDPAIFDHQEGATGIAAHVLSSADRARFAYEMARMYARSDAEEQMLRELARASEAGMDVQHAMHKDLLLARYEADPRVLVIVRNAQELRALRTAGSVPPMPALGDVKPTVE